MLSPTYKPLPYLVLFALTLLMALIYYQAFPGCILFDDTPNLKGLEQVDGWRTGVDFAVSGASGPLGRPLALLTFALQYKAWPNDPGALLAVNIAIHAVSVIAVFSLALGLLRLGSQELEPKIVWLAVAIAGLWGMSPFLATTHLMIIQRMTSLAGFFTFSGLAGFVWSFHFAAKKPFCSRVMLCLGLGFATLLAVLSKENGALLPLLAVVIYWLWIPQNLRLRSGSEKTLFWFLAILPSLFLLGYLGKECVSAFQQGYGFRYFTPRQRLLTEPSILLDYVYNLLIPHASSVSPYMDNIPAANGWLDPPEILISCVIWAFFIAVAVWLRKAAPYLIFGLVFFLAGHLLESSVIGLELYFSHRNYVPAFGLYFALVLGAASLPPQHVRLGIYALGAYLLLFMVVLAQVTSNWNQIGLTSERWLAKNPHSQRAAQFLGSHYLKFGDPGAALQILDNLLAKNPDLALAQLQRTLICFGREDKFQGNLIALKKLYQTIRLDLGVSAELSNIALNEKLSHYCPSLKYSDLVDITDVLLSNPNYVGSPRIKSHLLTAKAAAMMELDRVSEAIDLFIQAYQADPNLDVAFMALGLMSNAGQYDRAFQWLKELRKEAPDKLVTGAVWRNRVDAFYDILLRSRQIDEAKKIGKPKTEPAPQPPASP